MRVWLAVSLIAVSSGLADDAARIADLERRLSELDQKYRALEQKVGEKSGEKSAPTVSIGEKGVTFQSPDTNFVMRAHGLIQLDSHWYFEGGGNDTWLLRRARPVVIEGTFFNDLDFWLTPEFGNARAAGGVATATAVNILDAFLNYRFMPELQLRVGKFKEPVGLEQLQAEPVSFFTERSLVTDLVPSRDLGVMLHGEVLDGVMGYAVGFFNGVADGASSQLIDIDDQKEVAGRLFFHPFKKTSFEPLKGLGVGIAGSLGSRQGAGSIASYMTESAVTFFNYKTGTVGDGQHLRWSPQAYYYWGPFGLITEYAVSSQEISLGTAHGTMDHRAWQVTGGYVLTGENANYKGVIPNHPLKLSENQWGAFEVVARYSNLDIDDEAFPTFAAPGTSATRASAFSVGMNWYLNRNLRAGVNYVHTDFKGGAGNPSTAGDESAILTRFQFLY